MFRALLVASLLFPALAQGQQQKQTPREPGRFQIVNGTPGMAKNIMLLDTVTGETWVVCIDPSESASWCKMPKYEAPATGTRTAEPAPTNTGG